MSKEPKANIRMMSHKIESKYEQMKILKKETTRNSRGINYNKLST